MYVPQNNANAAFQLAGGNSLTGLGNWYLVGSPANGQVPAPTVAGYSIAKFIPQAFEAASQVGAQGPVSPDALSNVSAWPGTASLTPAQVAALPAGIAAAAATAAGSSTGGCGAKPDLFKIPLGPSITACNGKAIFGGAMIAVGGAVTIIGLALLVVAGIEGKGPAGFLKAPAEAVGTVVGLGKLGKAAGAAEAAGAGASRAPAAPRSTEGAADLGQREVPGPGTLPSREQIAASRRRYERAQRMAPAANEQPF
jgi:hypothetical protein